MDKNMKLFNDKYCCSCGENFEWKYLKLDKEKAVFYRIDDVFKNVKSFSETGTQYIIKVQCPKCLKKHFITIDK